MRGSAKEQLLSPPDEPSADDILNESWDTDESLPPIPERDTLSGNLAMELYMADNEISTSQDQKLESNIGDFNLTGRDKYNSPKQGISGLLSSNKATAENEDGECSELTLADLESDRESKENRRHLLPGSSYVTRDLRLMDWENNSPSRNGVAEYR